MKHKILIANRGEIAVRIIRACKELSIDCVAVYSKADEDSLHVKFADEAVCIGEAPSKDSYLNISRILSAAHATGCNAIHPGYGFLAENDRFADLVERCNIRFIGPKSSVIAALGNKVEARKLAIKAGIPIVPGSKGALATVGEAKKVASELGYPVLLKASSGGGGKGIRLIQTEEEMEANFSQAQLEAQMAFNDKSVYLEKYIINPHHIEVQILGDHYGNIIQLGERDCSIQRNNQKLVEESPAPFITESLRKRLGDAAIALARLVEYSSAGTMEFLVDDCENFYFMEMNTRIQVEHPVTEMVTGIDIVKEQIQIAYGHPLTITQEEVKLTGHAIECRINAEDPNRDFMPSPGKIQHMILPGGFGIRNDTHIYTNYVVPPYYDSMLLKLIVHAPTRKEAIRKMRFAIEQLMIDGIKTNIEFQYLIFHERDFVRGTYSTGFIDPFIQSIKENIHGSLYRGS